ncbi:DNA polymerase III subunit epsilon [Methylicorpusculum sp.]|uniref:DNA polymerase III subunit epsilon n=1 Tax=Methylicorpusculum sp. TaxID=2713644 RepID=UPI00273084B5|nr:DNA polymerase III subunit epsilon [Methylicorpusculum sp.]MDP2178396.1 DNA polymerase III subunit epsilon [Methylicorpusculum sp.]MDP3530769.1 DNA polymerase III subunit epsilon [Methylicorpusculum sp.]MDZ4150656.1 DNA polymerase III subunit epsilon [Methylicorpusculum sp.]
MSRQVVLDTETTGLNPQEGHRIIEIGCVELVNRRLTGRHFHVYINPQRVIDSGAIEVHGITNEFLNDKPLFTDIADDFIQFIKESELIIHNAPFDVGFINHEFALLDKTLGTVNQYSEVFDTLSFARKKHPGQRNSLDALCKRYGIDNSHRELHGALLDAEILAEVYLLMTGGQSSLLEEATDSRQEQTDLQVKRILADRKPLAIIYCNEDELQQHQARLAAIEKASGNCLWK